MTELHESIQGCGNHSCIIRKPKGQGTNGGCTCINRNMNTKEVREVKGFIHWQSQRVKELKAELALERRLSSDIALLYQQETNFKHTIKQIKEMATAKAKKD